jgi:hypothetical protein
MKTAHTFLAVVGAGAFCAALGAATQSRGGSAASAAPPAPITVGLTPPSDIGSNAPAATLPQAAAFAWNEFFALNWTAKTSTGVPGRTLRDTPDPSCAFGNPVCGKNRPLVWQTYRGKVEIFPGTGNPPSSYTTPPPNATTWSYGYDGGPDYNYGSPIPACTNQPTAPAPWVNLDETDQIGLDSMYAGVGPTPVPNASPGATNSQPQLIRFVAKANRTVYSYIEGYGFWQGAPGGVPSPGVPDPTPASQPFTSPAPGYVSLPNASFETKSGWRQLTATEMASGRFVTAPVRYYENSTGVKNGPPCWRQGTFGLVALHIIQKTPTAPYFVYATFEQADNILTAGGGRVENDDGAMGPSGIVLPPTTPRTSLVDVTASVPPGIQIPPKIVANGPLPCTAIGARLYYRNAVTRKALPEGAICVNRRQNPIPAQIISANASAHAALKSYEAAHGGYHSPFEHYKLINVQYVPIDKNAFGPYTGAMPATFSQANIVVETNHTLQLFSGGLVGGGTTGSNSDNPGIFGQSPLGKTYKNVFYNSKTYNMGGCMGCHGAAGQLKGGDFSVITVEGSVTTAEYPAPVTFRGAAAAVPRNRTFFRAKPLKAHY